jgi:hypothetical protein
MSKSENEQKWRELIQQRKDSGLSIKDWCNQNKVTFSTFKYWDNRLKKTDKDNIDWVKLRLIQEENNTPVAKPAPEPLILSIKNISISIPVSFDKKTLTELLSVLQEIC